MGDRWRMPRVCKREARGKRGERVERSGEGGAAGAERGSLTLEGAVVLPVFLTLVMAVLFLFRLTVIELALQRTADNAVGQIAVVLQPAESWLKRAGGLADSVSAAIGLDALADIAPEPVKSAVEGLFSEWSGGQILQPVLDRAFEPAVRYFVPEGLRGKLIDPERVTVEGFICPMCMVPILILALRSAMN